MKLEEQYKQETGDEFSGMLGYYDFYERYRAWLETRLTLALSRIEAAEERITRCSECINGPGSYACITCGIGHKHMKSIRAMEVTK